MYSYATLAQIKQQAEQENGNPLSDANATKALDFARRATRYVERETTRRFAPERDTVTFYLFRPDKVNRWYNCLRLPKAAAAINSVTIDDVAQTLSDFRLISRYELQRKPSTGTWLGNASSSDGTIEVDAVWVYREYYDREAWVNSGDSVQDVAGINTTATTITVTDTDGTDGVGQSPRFSAGQVIRCEDEYMIVTATSATTLTVIRGAQGTAAAAHDNGTQLDTFSVQPEAVRAVQLMAAFNVNNIGNYKRVSFDGVTTTENIEIPTEAVNLIQSLRPRYVRGF